MSIKPIAVLGTGMSGFGAAHALRAQGVQFVCYDKNAYCGGHTRSIQYERKFIFDEGPHISFTSNEHVKRFLLESVEGKQEERKLAIDNYWRGYRIPHPVHCNLHNLPPDLTIKIIEDFVSAKERAPRHEAGTSPQFLSSGYHQERLEQTYADWLVAVYGRTFAETFPAVYGRKYHTTTMDQLTTDWIGPRMYRPQLAEVLRGALTKAASDVHYIQTFRYPSEGGFGSYLAPFATEFDVRLNHKLTGIDPRAKVLRFGHGAIHSYSAVISSIPLPDLIPLIDGVPSSVIEAAQKLAFTSVVLVNIGITRSDISDAAITYFYDEDVLMSRVNIPHMLSPNNAPLGCGAIQAEVYFSDRYKPCRIKATELANTVIDDLRRCEFIRENDTILMKDVVFNKYANVIYNSERSRSLKVVHDFLDEVEIHYCGRYGNWDHSWTDQAFLSGESTAERVLDRLSG